MRHKQMLPPPPTPEFDSGQIARLVASTIGFAVAISLALFALALMSG